MRDYDINEADEALDIVLKHAFPLTPRPVALTEALDCVLAQDVIAPEDIPPFPCSAKDGFAVIAADTTNPRRLVGEQMAGYIADLEVTPGTCVRITTGAPMPRGADAVIMVE
jgi:gephyrin